MAHEHLDVTQVRFPFDQRGREAVPQIDRRDRLPECRLCDVVNAIADLLTGERPTPSPEEQVSTLATAGKAGTHLVEILLDGVDR